MIELVHVEDDADIREIVFLALTLTGQFNVIQFAGGREALAHVAETPPDLLLLDVMMPDLNGYETLEHMRALPALHTVPAIFMTAHSTDPTLKAWCDHVDVDVDVIHKPIDPLKLGEQIQQTLEKMRMRCL